MSSPVARGAGIAAGVPDVLVRILETKVREIESRKRAIGPADLDARLADAPPVRRFGAALEERIARGEPAVIAEAKKASPSRGVIRADFDPAAIAASYQRGGACCISVLTDEQYFAGHDRNIAVVRAASDLPVLRKEFIVDPYQVVESRHIGADCILLIVAALDDALLGELYAAATDLGMDVLVEVHDAAELDRALKLPGGILGVNNRDLRTFETRLETTIELAGRLPADRLLVTESGIGSRDDVAMMLEIGVRAFLVGESFMRAADPGEKLRELFFADTLK